MGDLAQMSGMSVMVLDLTGRGESPFKLDDTTPKQHLDEAVAAYDWLAKQYPGSRLHALGHSYGSFIMANLIRERAIEKLVLRAPAIYLPEDFDKQQKDIDRHVATSAYRRDAEAMRRHPMFSGLPTATRTLVVVHGLDVVVPHETTDVYAEMLAADVKVYPEIAHSLDGIVGSNPELLEFYKRDIAEWLLSN
jgi:pimeloyl-ACP methyl ester carboxylesterase